MIANVHDHRAGVGSSLHLEDARNGDGIECVGAQSVNRFGGEGDKLATAQKLGSMGDLVIRYSD